MWVAKLEVRWDAYMEFMALSITAPTPLYKPSHTFENGDEPDQPAVTMTQLAAQQFTKWLSAITGRRYRLPTEAEWE
jgi:formylglycine-generating enzyme required for sulfatase activity